MSSINTEKMNDTDNPVSMPWMWRHMGKEMDCILDVSGMDGSNPLLTVSIGSDDSTYEMDGEEDSSSEASSSLLLGDGEEGDSTKSIRATTAMSSSRSSTSPRSLVEDIPMIVRFEANCSIAAASGVEADTSATVITTFAVDSLSRLDWADDDDGGGPDSSIYRQQERTSEGYQQRLKQGEDLMDNLYQELVETRRESLKLTLQNTQMFDEMSMLTMQNELHFQQQEEIAAAEDDRWSFLEDIAFACFLFLVFGYLVVTGQVWIFPIILLVWWLAELLMPVSCEVEEEALSSGEGTIFPNTAGNNRSSSSSCLMGEENSRKSCLYDSSISNDKVPTREGLALGGE